MSLSLKQIKNGHLALLVLVVSLIAISIFALPYIGNAQTSTTSQATITITVNETISLALSSSTINLVLTPGTPVSTTITNMAVVNTNSPDGWDLQVNRDDADTTVDSAASSSINIPDATDYIATGNGSTSAAIGANLHFRVENAGTDAGLYESNHWGADDSVANALYAGFPVSAVSIASTTSYVSSAQTVGIVFRLDTPATQRALSDYSGTITFTAITKV